MANGATYGQRVPGAKSGSRADDLHKFAADAIMSTAKRKARAGWHPSGPHKLLALVRRRWRVHHPWIVRGKGSDNH